MIVEIWVSYSAAESFNKHIVSEGKTLDVLIFQKDYERLDFTVCKKSFNMMLFLIFSIVSDGEKLDVLIFRKGFNMIRCK